MAEFETVTIAGLPDLTLAIGTFLEGCNADGKSGKTTAAKLATFLAPYVNAIGASNYVATTGNALPNIANANPYFTFVGKGVFTQSNGASITTTENLNLLSRTAVANGVWSLTIGIPITIDLTKYATKTDVETAEYGVIKQIENVFDAFPLSLGFINTSGTISGDGTDSNWQHTDFLYIDNTADVTYQGAQTPSNVLQIAFYDENKAFISGVPGGTNGVINPASNVRYARFCRAAFSPRVISGSFYTKTASSISAIETELAVLNDAVFEAELQNITNVFTSTPITFGFITTTGAISGDGTDNNWLHTGFIKLKKSSTVTYQGTQTPSNVLQVAFYDENKTFVSGVPGGTDGSINSPDFDGYYVRFSSLNAGSPIGSVVSVASLLDLIRQNTQIVIDENSDNSKNYFADVNMFIQYGQSLSQGDWEDKVILNTQKYNSLMFTGGIRVWENRNQATKYNALVPAVESVFIYASGETVVGAPQRGETPAVGTANKIVELIKDEDGIEYTDQQYQMLVSAPGMGGTGIVQLSDKNGIYYKRLLADVTAGKTLSMASGKTFYVPAVSWIQGEYDTYYDMSQNDYYNLMVVLFDNLNQDIKQITGQLADVKFFLYQTACFDHYYGNKFTYPDVSLAQLKISLEKKNVYMASPIRHLPLIGDYVHFTAEGSHWFGGYLGIAYKRTVIDGEDFKPIHVKEKKVIGNNIYLKFHAPVYPIRFTSTPIMPDRGVSKGFQIRNPGDRAQNSFLNIITDVQINKFDTVKITCSSNPIGKKLTYSINGTGQLNMSSGNLCDSQEIKFNFPSSQGGQEVVHDMYNWCPLFELIV